MGQYPKRASQGMPKVGVEGGGGWVGGGGYASLYR